MACEHPRQMNPYYLGVVLPCAAPACANGIRDETLKLMAAPSPQPSTEEWERRQIQANGQWLWVPR